MMKTPNFESIKQVNVLGSEYWSARDLMEALGYENWQNFEKVIQRAIDVCASTTINSSEHFSLVSKKVLIGFGAKREIKDYYLTRYALHLLLICSNAKKSETIQALAYLTLTSLEKNIDHYAIANELDISIRDDIDVTHEQKTINQIRRAFIHLTTIPQYKVASYYIDLYFPSHKIAVECDEQGHRRYLPENEIKRQKYIESTLNCTFVRYNPDALDFNIGDVINQLIVLIYGL